VNTKPLGVFDSGVGGLTVVRALQEIMPGESIVYLGDTARVPYGSKSPETICRFADEDARFLINQQVKAIVVACNTASAHALTMLQAQYRIPIIGVIEAGIDAALDNPNCQRVGVIATRGTIRSHAYQHALAQRQPGLLILDQATPLLVPLVEEDWLDHPVTREILHVYLDPLCQRGMDTLLLACTHYPLLIPLLSQMLDDNIRLVDSASTCAAAVHQRLQALDLLAPPESEGSLRIFLTDLSEQFETLAGRFLKNSPGRIKRVSLG